MNFAAYAFLLFNCLNFSSASFLVRNTLFASPIIAPYTLFTNILSATTSILPTMPLSIPQAQAVCTVSPTLQGNFKSNPCSSASRSCTANYICAASSCNFLIFGLIHFKITSLFTPNSFSRAVPRSSFVQTACFLTTPAISLASSASLPS